MIAVKKSFTWLKSTKVSLLVLILVLLGLVGGYFYAYSKGFRFGQQASNSNRQSTLVTKKLESASEVVFLNVGIQRVDKIEKNSKIPGTNVTVPMSSKRAIIILNYTAKFGIKEKVSVKQVGRHKYQVTIPKYQVIGFQLDEKSPYELYSTSGEFLSYSTENIDTGKAVTDALSAKEQTKYLEAYKEQITQAAKGYYTLLAKGFDNKAQLVFTNQN